MLEGGHWYEQRENAELRAKTCSVPITNQRGEGDFGALRQKLDTQPSATPATLETQLMLKYNRPVTKFLKQKTDTEKETIWRAARNSFADRKKEEKREKEEFYEGLTTQRLYNQAEVAGLKKLTSYILSFI